LDMALKVKGLYSPEKHEHEVTTLAAAVKEIQKSGGSCLDD